MPDQPRNELINTTAGAIGELPGWRKRRLAKRLGLGNSGEAITFDALGGLDEELLGELVRYFARHPEPHVADIWPEPGFRLFVSHVNTARARFEILKAECESYGIYLFLAHDNIEGGALWRESLLRALDTMHAMLTVHSTGFRASEWTGQEVGYALCRKVPIVSLMDGEAPCGFLQQVQGFRWREGEERTLAGQIFAQLNEAQATSNQVGEALAWKLKQAGSYAASDSIVMRLRDCRSISDRAGAEINLAYRFNDQVYKSGALAALSEILERFGKAIDLHGLVDEEGLLLDEEVG